MAVKAFFGYGAKTFGNPQGDTSGSGGPDGHLKPPPPQPPPTPPPVLNLAIHITSDYDPQASFQQANGVALSALLTAPQLADWIAGKYATMSIDATGAPPNGFWRITGSGGGFTQSGPGFHGLVIDVAPASVHAVITINMTGLLIAGGGGTGGNQAGAGNGGAGGDAIHITAGNPVDVVVDLSAGGECFGAGGGGRWGNPIQGGAGGGGGAAGWNAGRGLDGGSIGHPWAVANGGTGVVATTHGGAGGNANSGTGGDMGAPGSGGDNGTPILFPNGAAGFAVQRVATAGATTTPGSAPTNLTGAVQ
jgi:hypothetical protein